jgi:hypothetical protein
MNRSIQNPTALGRIENDVTATCPAPCLPRLEPGQGKKVCGRIVEVHRALHETHAENSRIEVEIPLRVAGDRRNVVNAW